NRSYLTTPVNANQAAGATGFSAPIATLPLIGAASCTTCHALPTATNRMVISGQIINTSQSFKVPQLRNLYRKQGLTRGPGPQKTGFGFTNDGAIDNLTSFLALQQFNSWPASVKDDLVQFLLAFDTGTAPAVGYQVTIDQANATDPVATGDLALLVARALAGD